MKSLLSNIALFATLAIFWPLVWNPNTPYTLQNFVPGPPDTTNKDTTLPYPFKDQGNIPSEEEGWHSPLYMTKPGNIVNDVEYDPENNEYNISEKIGNFDYRPSYSMSFDDYLQYDFNKSIKKYWFQRFRSENFEHQRSIIPNLHINSEVFDRIFGSNTIDIKPQGYAELIFGVNIQRTDNPTLPEKLRRTTTFDFQEKIQMNVTGQIGDKLKLQANYNTEASFDFENKMNLAYEGKEDEIIRKIEAGNVSLPLTGSLITGSYSLFGIKTELQFGRLTVTSIISQQKGKSSSVEVQGGAQVQDFEVYGDQYEANRHFFIGHYFYNNYDRSLANLPVISSGINITKIEVWVTNKTGNFQDARNLIAFTDLGEKEVTNSNIQVNPTYPYSYPSDSINSLFNVENDYPGIRSINEISTALPTSFVSGQDYEKLESARLLSSSEYTLNTTLGYISLNSALNSDEVLAVAYEYTVSGKVFRVGEFSNSVDAPKTLVLKLLKGTALTPKHPTWNLMMKNVYSIGAYQVNSEDFSLDVMYQNDKTGTAVNIINEGAIKGTPLLTVVNLDNLNSQLDRIADGMFDYIDKVTIYSSNGRVIFPVVEPFGQYLYEKMIANNPADSVVAKQYVYTELYDSTQSKARQIAEKNKFFLKGQYKSSTGSEISLNAFNIPQGSVTVTAGGVILTENVDYTVDYTMGKVKIINQGLLESGTPIKISLESNSLFNIQSKTLLGTHLNYQISKDFNVGATVLNLTERPLTQKVNIGDEPISNTIWGVDATYSTECPFLTRMIDKLPFIETKAPSSILFNGEFAHLIPGHNKAIEKSGISYIDDFEGSKSSIDLRSISSWVLASTPQGQSILPEGNQPNSLEYGFNRARFAWYVIDPLFLRNNSATPEHIKNTDQQNNHFVREIYEEELFPLKENANGVPTNISVLNIAFYPKERGPYNYDASNIDSDGNLLYPQRRWGGIMRQIQSNDFETANIEFIEFWLMDPFVYDSTHTGGKLYFNLGNVSEDILRDGRKSFENGLPSSSEVTLVDTTVWGRVPITQSIVNAFDNTASARQYQDIGLDGLSDSDERSFFSTSNPYQTYAFLDSIKNQFGETSLAYTKAYADPSSDDYHYYRGSDYDNQEVSILDRYKKYNGMEGNSPTSEQSTESYSTSATTAPNVEDINRDNTLSETEAYFQYSIDLRPDKMYIGSNYISDIVVGQNDDGEQVNWYQFKVPIYEPDTTIGNISDFKSIRFFRMFLNGFNEDVFLRFARLELVRGEWRKYNYSFLEGGPYLPTESSSTSFDVSAVNIEENGTKQPVNYVLPPGVSRVIDPTNPQLRQLNEQALVLKVCELDDGDARACYRNVDMDVRQYKRLQMFTHAEALSGMTLNNNDLCVFIRLGSDYQNNYYEYEIPLQVTAAGTYDNDNDDDRELVWPTANMFDFAFEDLQQVKQSRNNAMRVSGSEVSLTTLYSEYDGDYRLSVMGNPNLSNVKTIMIGIRNRKKLGNPLADDGLGKCAEVWVNELRLTDFDEKGGWAANARVTARLADLGTLTMSGSTSKPGFGSIEKKVSERSKEDVYQYDIASNLELGKFFPERIHLSIPMYVGYSESFSNPEYNPLDPDIPTKVSLKELQTEEERDSLKKMIQDYTKRKSLNFTNVKINKLSKGNPKVYDISNFSVSYSYSEQFSRNVNTEYNTLKNYRGALAYNYNTTPKNYSPFKNNAKLFKSPLLKLIKDFNLNYTPTQLSFTTDIDRQYNEVQLRNINTPTIKIPTQYTKDFSWNRVYDFKYDITRSLRFDFSATNTALIDEPTVNQRVNKAYSDEYEQWKDTVWQSIMDFGRTTNYHHTFNLNYTIPINKIPLFNWLSSTARYGGTYDWVAGARTVDTIKLGNTIKNTNTKQFTATANMVSLYNNISYLKKINQKYGKQKKPSRKKETEKVQYPKQGDPPRFIRLKKDIPKIITHKLLTEDVTVKLFDTSGTEIQATVKIINANKVSVTTKEDYAAARIEITGEKVKEDDPLLIALEQTLRILMSVRNITFTYSNSSGTFVPGYMPKTQFLGLENQGDIFAPGFNFITGMQDRDFLLYANENDWLTDDTLMSSSYMMNSNSTFNLRATIEPINGMRIDVTANRRTGQNITEYYKYDATSGTFERYGTMISGSFDMTYNTWNTAFERLKQDDNYSSETFNKFKDYRVKISHRLGAERAQSSSSSLYNYVNGLPTEFSDGYSAMSQEVIIPAFLAAYSGKNPDKISLSAFPSFASVSPNWSITYDGLSKLKPVKKYFRTMTLSHTYRSSYSVNSYNTNLLFDSNEDGFSWVRYEALGDFIPEQEINGISISEQFSPLICVDGTMNNSLILKVQIDKSRNLSFTFSNNQLTEVRSDKLVLGTGYRFKSLSFEISGKEFKSDLNLRADVSIRNDFTLVRKLEETTTGGYDQLTQGNKVVAINITADYVLSDRFNLQFYIKRNVTKPKVSSSYDRYNTDIGISVRFTLDQ